LGKGDGRLRAKADASSRATAAYSSVRCARHTASVSPTISSNRGFTIAGTLWRLDMGVSRPVRPTR